MPSSGRHRAPGPGQPANYHLDGRYRYIERYLSQLARLAPGGDRDELVMEARRHLFDAMESAVSDGVPAETAQREAIRAFGPAPRIALAAWRARGLPGVRWAELRSRLLGRGQSGAGGASGAIGTEGEMTA